MRTGAPYAYAFPHLMRKLLENLELILTAAGLLVIFMVHSFFHWGEEPGSWKFSAFTAIAVGVIHGVIFWLVRKRQRRIRREALDDVEQMLKDVINNNLCVISFTFDLQRDNTLASKEAQERATESIARIHDSLNHISEESLSVWKKKYARKNVGRPVNPR